MSDFARITWGRNKQGRLIPLTVSYYDPIISTEVVVRRDIRASTAEAEIRRITLPTIKAFTKFIEIIEPPKPRKVAQPSRAVSDREARIAKIRATHQRMKRSGIIPEDRSNDLLSEWVQ